MTSFNTKLLFSHKCKKSEGLFIQESLTDAIILKAAYTCIRLMAEVNGVLCIVWNGNSK